MALPRESAEYYCWHENSIVVQQAGPGIQNH